VTGSETERAQVTEPRPLEARASAGGRSSIAGLVGFIAGAVAIEAAWLVAIVAGVRWILS
jgi:hypothetical protein